MEETKEKETTEIEVPEQAKFKVYWYDKPENYNRDNRLKIKNDVAKKYGISSKNVEVIYKTLNSSGGDKIELENGYIDNVLDINYQKQLFEEWVKREEKNVDFDRLMKLDDTINSELDFDFDKELNKTWRLNMLQIDNFLSFGEGNRIRFEDIKGFTVVTSDPENQAGKTTFCLDAIKFLLFGTTTKTKNNKEVFNEYSQSNKVSVKGEIEVDNVVYFIERKLSKTESKSGNVNVNNTVNYYKYISEEGWEKLNGEDAKQTQTVINEAVGRERDFDSVVMANDRSLEDLINATPAENGKLLNRFIGLEMLAEKESVARSHSNDFQKKMLANTYDITNLNQEIEDLREKNETCNNLLSEKNKQFESTKKELKDLSDKRDELVNKKKPIDEELKNVDKDKLEKRIEEIKEKGKQLRKKKEEYNEKLNKIGDIEFDEEYFTKKHKVYNEKIQKKGQNDNEIERLTNLVKELENGQICPTCKRPLEDVDHSGEIKANNDKIEEYKKENEELNTEIKKLDKELVDLDEKKKKVDEKNKLELEADKVDVEIENMRSEYKENDDLLKKFNNNENNIIENKNIDTEITNIKSKIEVKEGEKEKITKEIERLNSEVNKNNDSIEEKNKLIDKIKKEKEVERLYKVYIEMLSRKGVRKIILQSVLPIINSELNKLLDDVCNFTVTLDINHKDEVQFYIHKNGGERPLRTSSGFESVSASLALRAVLGKLSNLPTPNFVVFDEIFGKVGKSNMWHMKELLEKVTDMYDIVFFITHYDEVKDWADNIISVTNEKDISKLEISQ